MNGISQGLSSDMLAVVNDLALRFALVDDAEVIADLKALRTGFVDEYAKLFGGVDESGTLKAAADAVVVELLKCVVVKRHDVERCGSVVSRSIH